MICKSCGADVSNLSRHVQTCFPAKQRAWDIAFGGEEHWIDSNVMLKTIRTFAEHKPCAKCGEGKRVKDNPYCLDCKREINRISHAKHGETYDKKAQDRKHYRENREAILKRLALRRSG